MDSPPAKRRKPDNAANNEGTSSNSNAAVAIVAAEQSDVISNVSPSDDKNSNNCAELLHVEKNSIRQQSKNGECSHNSVQRDNDSSKESESESTTNNSSSEEDESTNSTSSDSDSSDDSDSNSSSVTDGDDEFPVLTNRYEMTDLDTAMYELTEKSVTAENLARSLTLGHRQSGKNTFHRKRRRKRPTKITKSVSVETATDNDININDLPSFILVKIFGLLPLHTLLLRVAVICRAWYALTTDSSLWRHLDLKGQLRASDEVLLRLTRYSQKVVSVDISSVQWITSKGLTRMLQHCKYLEVLKINWPSSIIGDESLGKIGELCSNLRHLSLSSAYMLSDDSVKKIARGCPQLTHLAIGHCQLVSDEGIIAIAENCPNLQFLLLDKCVRISEDSIESLAAGCLDLTTLSLTGCRKMRSGLHIKKLKKLWSLDISQISDFDVISLREIVSSCENLQRLNMSLVRTVTDDDIKYIAKKLNNLQYLHLVGCKLTDRAMHHLGNLGTNRTLVHLDVGWCEGVSDEGVCYVVERCRALRYLGLIRCDLVTMVTLRELMMRYPNVQFSNFHLDCERLLWEYRLTENA
ncbi:F-box/LRR-repeat protein 17-like [Tubulanus polymorphus]|uniref:F-box/LRR-repeat protein 17-like n=1 Tax=Tubulanus polymorphus TaxID=672921 RepID=UPI003DA686B3